MRIYFLSILIIFTCEVAISQNKPIKYHFDGLRAKEKRRADRIDRLGIDVHWNSWYDKTDDIKVKPSSIGISVYGFFDMPMNKKSTVSLGLGYGYMAHNVKMNGLISTDSTADGNYFTSLTPHDSSYNYKTNRMTMNTVFIPLELRIRKNGNNRFRFYPGVYIGYTFNPHTKTIDDSGKYKDYNFADLDPFRYGASLKIGFNWLLLTGYYSLKPVFSNEKSTKIAPFGVGLSFFIL